MENIKTTKFGNGSAYLIEDAQFKEKIFIFLDSVFGKKVVRDQFPGPQPVSIEKKNIQLGTVKLK